MPTHVADGCGLTRSPSRCQRGRSSDVPRSDAADEPTSMPSAAFSSPRGNARARAINSRRTLILGSLSHEDPEDVCRAIGSPRGDGAAVSLARDCGDGIASPSLPTQHLDLG